MKLANDNSGTYIENDVQHNDKDPKFKVGDHVKISKYMTNFEVTKKKEKRKKNAVSWTNVISHFNGKDIVGKLF